MYTCSGIQGIRIETSARAVSVPGFLGRNRFAHLGWRNFHCSFGTNFRRFEMSFPTSRWGTEDQLLRSGDGVPLGFCMVGEGLKNVDGTSVEDGVLTAGATPGMGSSLSGSFDCVSRQAMSSAQFSAVPGVQ